MNFNEFVSDIQQRLQEIPTGNSAYVEDLHIKEQLTPGREYQFIVLQCLRVIKNIKSNEFKRKRKLIEIEQCVNKLNRWYMKLPIFKYKRRLLEIELDEFQYDSENLKGLLIDAQTTLENLQHKLSLCHRYTREEFEAEEKHHFKKRFELTAQGITGAHRHLYTLERGAKQLEAYKQDKTLLLSEPVETTHNSPEAMAKYHAMLLQPPKAHG